MAIRKDANTLDAAERAELVAAVRELKVAGIYDNFVLRHAQAHMPSIHSCPAFLPWHRRFIWDYERELQRVSGNPDLGLPYWNWPSGDASASMWNDDLLGGNGDGGGVVQSGPFRSGQWTVVNASGSPAGPLTRDFGNSGLSTLSTQADINQVLAVTPYDTVPWNRSSNPSFRNQVEGWSGPNLHNRGHVWVGGSMLPMTSPNDPVFFMHHCMVDKVWHEWQLRFPNQGYLPETGGAFGQNLMDPMNNTPTGTIGQRPFDVLDSAAIGIEYDQLMPGTPPPGGGGTQVPVLTVDDAPTAAGIGAPGEVDLFQFEVVSFGTHTIETTGSTDTFMTLLGPNDPNAQVTTNDDGGQDLNARISQTLSAGTYFVRVRHYSSTATGAYAIGVRRDQDDTIPTITVNSSGIDAAIGARRESDLFSFQADTQGTYTVQTTGSTDTFLTVFGPDSQTTTVDADDDSGVGLNPRLILSLAPGRYFARVRHYSPLGTGAYTIRVSRS